MIPLTTLYDEYIDRPKLSEKTHLSIWPLFLYELVLLLFVFDFLLIDLWENQRRFQ